MQKTGHATLFLFLCFRTHTDLPPRPLPCPGGRWTRPRGALFLPKRDAQGRAHQKQPPFERLRAGTGKDHPWPGFSVSAPRDAQESTATCISVSEAQAIQASKVFIVVVVYPSPAMEQDQALLPFLCPGMNPGRPGEGHPIPVPRDVQGPVSTWIPVCQERTGTRPAAVSPFPHHGIHRNLPQLPSTWPGRHKALLPLPLLVPWMQREPPSIAFLFPRSGSGDLHHLLFRFPVTNRCVPSRTLREQPSFECLCSGSCRDPLWPGLSIPSPRDVQESTCTCIRVSEAQGDTSCKGFFRVFFFFFPSLAMEGKQAFLPFLCTDESGPLGDGHPIPVPRDVSAPASTWTAPMLGLPVCFFPFLHQTCM